MADSAEELLKKMAEKTSGANKKEVPIDSFYSSIEINKNKRTSLAVGVLFFFLVFTSILFANISLKQDWALIVGPVLLCGGALVLIPMSEKWIYKPWQVKPQQYERHFTD